MCVRSVVKCYGDLLGRQSVKEMPFQGVKHIAIGDCSQQIRYLVKASNAVLAFRNCHEGGEFASKTETSALRLLKRRRGNGEGGGAPSKVLRMLPSPEASFEEGGEVVA